MYEPRTYRHWVKSKELVSFNVVMEETDLYIRASKNLKSKALKLVAKYRTALEKYIDRYPSFQTTLEPFPTGNDSPLIVRAMSQSATRVGVGPMASVAGAIAEFVGKELLNFAPEVIVENGGDIFVSSLKEVLVGIYAGKSPLTGRIALQIRGEDTPLGICTSSATVGHSLSYGEADAVIVLSQSATLADAAATAIGNLIKQPEDIPSGIEFAKNVDGLKGVLIIKDDNVGVWGEVKLVKSN